MVERVQIGDAVLYCGDCREVLPEQANEVILTDPVWPRCPTQTIAGSDRPYELWTETCAAIPSACSRVVVVMRSDCDPRFLQPTPGKFFRVMILPYVMPGYIGRALGGDELAYWFGSVIKSAPGRRVIPGRGPLVQPGFKGEDDHPMTRPLPHFSWLVNWVSDQDEIVCDPMMGGGTTGVACAQLGRKFIGIEIERRWFDIACRRIDDAQRQGRLDFGT